jgi:hypothetical protein
LIILLPEALSKVECSFERTIPVESLRLESVTPTTSQDVVKEISDKGIPDSFLWLDEEEIMTKYKV